MRINKRNQDCSYQNALSHAIHAPDASSLEDVTSPKQLHTYFIFVLGALSSSINLHVGDAILGLGDTNYEHHLVVGADHVSVDPPSLGIDRAAALIILLLGSPGIGLAFALDDIVVRRTALQLR